ncbi:MAG: hypothetical protein ACQETE_00210 [Bacteroidota bacterium]
MKFLLILLSCILLINDLHSQDIEIIQEVDDYHNVLRYEILNDSLLVVLDNGNKSDLLSLVNIASGEIVGSTRKGNGPGEISGRAIRIYVDRKRELIKVWDYGQLSMDTYDYDFNLLSEKLVDPPGMTLSAVPLNKDKILTLNLDTKSLAKIYDTKADSVTKTIKYTDQSLNYLGPIKANPLLKQGHYLMDNARVYASSKYSSVIFCLNEDGIKYIVPGVLESKFPEMDVDDGYSLPSMHEYVHSTLDMSIYDNKIYLLTSGKSISFVKGMWAYMNGKVDQKFSELRMAKEIYVYQVNDGAYLEKITLPYSVKLAKYYDDKIYCLKEDEKGYQSIVILANRNAHSKHF